MTSRTLSTQALLQYFDIRDRPFEAVRLTKRELRFDLENSLRDNRLKADGPVTFRTFAQSNFNPRDVFYSESPWIPGTPLPPWALLVRVEAEVHTL